MTSCDRCFASDLSLPCSLIPLKHSAVKGSSRKRQSRHLWIFSLLVALSIYRCDAFERSSSLRTGSRYGAGGGGSISHTRRVAPLTTPTLDRQQSSSPRRWMQEWEGDDLRWSTRLRRRLQRRRVHGDPTPIKTTLVALNILFFIYQTITTVNFIRRGHPSYWPRYAVPIIADATVGSSVLGPLTLNFAFSNSLSNNQPHRFLTSGFLHGGILHLLINMDTFRRQPSWLETGLGGPLYLTTFLLSIVAGNLGHMYSISDPFNRVLCLGSSGGICGLYGLLYASLVKMGNGRAASRIARGMAILLVMGLFIDNVSTAAHLGGFFGGIVMGILFGPSYQKNYSMRRKNSAEYDPAPRDYRQAMGFGVLPTKGGLLPLPFLWVGIALLLAIQPKYRTMPALMLKGFLFPGSLTP